MGATTVINIFVGKDEPTNCEPERNVVRRIAEEAIPKFDRFRFYNGSTSNGNQSKNVTQLKYKPVIPGATPAQDIAGTQVTPPNAANIAPYRGIEHPHTAPVMGANMADAKPTRLEIEFMHHNYPIYKTDISVPSPEINFIKRVTLTFVSAAVGSSMVGDSLGKYDIVYGTETENVCEFDRDFFRTS